MNEYELVYILKPDMPADRHQRVLDRVQKILVDSKAQVLDQKDWGKRKMAYRLEKNLFGHYIYFNFSGTGAFVTELERMLKYEEGVMRFMTVKLAEDVPPGESKVKKVNQPEEMRLKLDDSREFSRPYRGDYRGDDGDDHHHHHHHTGGDDAKKD